MPSAKSETARRVGPAPAAGATPGTRLRRLRVRLAAAPAQVRGWFPDREFFMRAHGQVRFIRLSGRLQMRVAAGAALALLVWLGVMIAMLVGQVLAQRDLAALRQREAAVTQAEQHMARTKGGVAGALQDLQRRQDMIETMVKGQLGDLPPAEASATDGKPLSLNGAPEAATLSRLAGRQAAFVAALTHYADARATQAETAIRRVGLNPAQVAPLRLANRRAMGGPLIALGQDDPALARLGQAMTRLSALEQGLARLPHALPASADYISSGFGYRADPFTGGGAFHPGLDFKGPIGAPIYAAAQGVVSFAGVRSGYGNCVEVDHGQGLVTRYAHMSRIEARPGQRVGPGVEIGKIGSTGRSTGPHLHFEVRIADRPVDPRPFLETLPDVFKEAGHDHP
ncbi:MULTISPECIES: M23 family metallopeptidase [unclassified Novosphingobium]|uniref:M23 family metallopeptidase n=1 Tax=unclassified Novosphingobium TaxID=2644732 RepID=UPI0017C1F59B|nr:MULTISPECIES: M23 family metallopeptidase [unclassified Novosphingobium]NMN05664.1 murein DD-endopeptidase MepM/ murein hydrolase activator NlpD [Novosphingobium sp. SG919]NMN87976.1 murein DD-endopeptidase MepM/ murein hydrolase activator NlpD [Novosphingobium sp. SG916]